MTGYVLPHSLRDRVHPKQFARTSYVTILECWQRATIYSVIDNESAYDMLEWWLEVASYAKRLK